MKARFLWSWCAGLLLLSSVFGYDVQLENGHPVTWNSGTVTMKLLLNTTPVLSDGSTYVSSVQTALQAWNSQIASVQFANETGLAVSPANNTTNEIAFDSTVYGTAFDANVIAITVFYYTSNPRPDGSYRRTQADIIFNAAYTWDSYRGPLRSPEDIQRVALHELGHVLGLNHPDEAIPPQSVSAQMNSHVSNLDTLTSDDIAGAQSLYGAPVSAPTILANPGNQSVYTSQTAQFNVVAAGNPAPTFRWQRKPSGGVTWSDLSDSGGYSGVTTAGLSVAGVILSMSGDQFRCVVTNSSGSATSNAASLTVTASVLPVITSQPSSQTVLEGSSVTFSAAASGVPAPVFQWQKGGVNISGATTSLYSISSARAADAGSYTVVVSNFAGTVTSNPAILTVNSPPTVTNLSAARVVLHPGQSLGLAVNATGNGTLGFKWTHNGRVVSGATSNTLTIGTVSLSDSGYYLVDVTDTFGTRRSAPMFVIVTPATTQVLTWGGGSILPTIPPGTDHAVSIAPGLILNTDGTVVGLNYYSQTPVPSGLTDIVAISSIASGGGASGFALALKSDGTITGWGSLYGDSLVPPGLTGVVAISVGGHHALALKSDGTVVAWGQAQYGATAVPVGLKDVIEIAAGTDHSLALKSDGTVVAWGDNSWGQTNVPNGLTNVMSIAAGYAHSLALKIDGTVAAWGSDSSGESSKFSGLTNLAAVYAGYYYSLAIKKDGRVIGFGSDAFNQIPVPTGLTNIIGLPSGSSYPLALRDSSKDLAPTVTAQPVSLSRVEGAEAIFSVIASSGTGSVAYQWRRNGIEIAGATSSSIKLDHVLPADAGQYDVVVSNNIGSSVSAVAMLSVSRVAVVTSASPKRQVLIPGQTLNLAVTASGTGNLTYQWFRNGRPISGATAASFSITSATIRDAGYYFVDIKDTVGVRRSAAFFVKITPANTKIVAWGVDYQHETDVPVTLKRPIAVAAGGFISLALEADGSVVSWGYPLGNPPVALADVVAFDAGEYDALALKSDGTVVAWGFSPPPVPDKLSNVVAIAAGATSLAVKSDGTVVAWGRDDLGQVAFAAGLSGIVDVAANSNFLLALKSDGTVVEWGDVNNNGVPPVPIPSNLSNVIALSTGWSNSAALKMDGSVVVWGFTYANETDVPAGLSNVAAISIGSYEALALKGDGTLTSWGGNAVAQKNSLAAGLTHVAAIATSENHSLALCESVVGDVKPQMTSQPVSAVVVLGGTATFTGSAGGAPAPTYQWQKNGVNLSDGGGISGATAEVLNLTGVKTTDAGVYTLVATNSAGSVKSKGVNLTLGTLGAVPSFTTQPRDQEAKLGNPVIFSVVAIGSPVLKYQWRKNGLNITGAKGSTFTINSVSGDDVGDYSVVASNGVDAVVSDSGHLSVDTRTSAPTFVIQPTGLTIGTGYSITFSASATGAPAPTYQWQKNGQDIRGATDSAYTISHASAGDAGSYSVIATNSAGSAVSQAAILMVSFAPEITVQPWVKYYVAVGAGVTFSATAAGYPAPTYQWRKDGVNISGANDSSYAITKVSAGDAGTYSVQATNSAGSATSTDASLVIVPYTAPTVKVLGDFDGDGKADLFWSNAVTGERSMWFLNGNTTNGGASLAPVPAVWQVSATADFDGDGKADIFWTNPMTGDRAMWLMNGSIMQTNTFLGTVPGNWIISGVGDFNGDGKSDVVWTNAVTGDRAMWLMNGSTVLGGGYLGTVPVQWVISGVGDFNGDGKADLVWSNTETGERAMWFQNGSTTVGGATLGTVPTDWVIAGVADFNGDGKADIFLSNTTTGDRVIWLMNGSTIVTNAFMGTVPVEWTISGTGDFNGDGKKDVFWTNTATGDRAMWLLNGATVTGGGFMGTVPVIWTINH